MIYLNTEIKTQTPYLKAQCMSYPIKKMIQINKLKDTIDYVYWLCTEDINIPGTSPYSGRIYRIKGKDLYNYINEKGYKDKNNAVIKSNKRGDMWINIPFSKLKLVGYIDKDKMKKSGIGGTGNSIFSRTDMLEWYPSNYKLDSNKMNTKGMIGEMIMKEYFESQERVIEVEKPEDIYNPVDMILTIKEKDKAA